MSKSSPLATPYRVNIPRAGHEVEILTDGNTEALIEWRAANPQIPANKGFGPPWTIAKICTWSNGSGNDSGPDTLLTFEQALATAEFIVEACNAHPHVKALIEAVTELLEFPECDTPLHPGSQAWEPVRDVMRKLGVKC